MIMSRIYDVPGPSKRFLKMSESEIVKISNPLPCFGSPNSTVSEGDRLCQADLFESAKCELLACG